MSLKHFIKTQVLSSYNKDSKEIEKKEKKENVFNDNIDDRIGVFKSKERIIFLIGVVSIFFSSIISVFAANYLYSSSEVSFDNSSSGISSDNVQGAIDELYQNASDYSSLDSRIGALEGRWKNEATSYFDGNDLRLGVNASNGETWANFYVNGVNAGAIGNASNGGMYIVAKGSTGVNGEGSLNIRGNPVMVNGTDIMKKIGSLNTVAQVDMNTHRTYTITCSAAFPTFLLYGYGSKPIGYIFAASGLQQNSPSIQYHQFGASSETITFSVQKGKIILTMPGDYKQFTIISSYAFTGTIS